ncbi:MAG: hypothetical protein ACFB20_11475 [Opitutales bacterium]
MWYIENNFVVKLGGTLFLNCQSLVDHRGETLFNLRKQRTDNFLEVDLEVYDKHERRKASFEAGMLKSGAEYDFRITNEPAFYCIHDLNRRVDIVRMMRVQLPADRKQLEAVDIETRLWRNLPSNVEVQVEVDLDLYTPSGFRFIATPDSTNSPGSTFVGVIMEDSGTGVCVD